MLEARIIIDAPENWVKNVSESANIRIKEVKSPSHKLTENFVEITSEKMTPAELVAHLRGSGGIVKSDLIRAGRDKVIGTVTTHDCPVCSTFSGLDCFLVSAETKKAGKMEWRVFVSGDSGLKSLCSRLDDKGVNYEIAELTQRVRSKEITSRQEEITRVAYDLGYFEFPKRINLEGLEGKLGISVATLSEILRRAEKNIISAYFEQQSD